MARYAFWWPDSFWQLGLWYAVAWISTLLSMLRYPPRPHRHLWASFWALIATLAGILVVNLVGLLAAG